MKWLSDLLAFGRAAATALGYSVLLAAVIFTALHERRK